MMSGDSEVNWKVALVKRDGMVAHEQESTAQLQRFLDELDDPTTWDIVYGDENA